MPSPRTLTRRHRCTPSRCSPSSGQGRPEHPWGAGAVGATLRRRVHGRPSADGPTGLRRPVDLPRDRRAVHPHDPTLGPQPRRPDAGVRRRPRPRPPSARPRRTPVLECTYSRRKQRVSLLRELADHAAPLWVVELEVSAEDAVSRFRRRHQPSDLTDQLVQQRAQSFPHSDQALQFGSTATTAEDTARRIADWLAQPPPPADRPRWAATGNDSS
jgi:hypothetical protein